RASVEDLIVNRYSVDFWLESQNWFRRLRGLPPIVESPETRALEELRNARVNFNPQGAPGIVQLRAEASNPPLALDITNTEVDVLLARTRSFNVDDAKSIRQWPRQQNPHVPE